MKTKIIVAICTLLGSYSMLAQQKVERAVGDFNEVKVYDLIEVSLLKAEESKVVIKGEHAEEVQIINKNGTLRLKMAFNKKFRGENTFVEVYYKELDLIDANQGAKIRVVEPLSQEAVRLNAQEGATIHVELAVQEVRSRSITGGIVEASGATEKLEVVLGTGGVFEGKSLKSEEATVRITVAGEAEVYASEKADINMRIGGNVVLYGNPKEINQNSFAGGRVKVIGRD
ncbi:MULTISPECIES: head GIN domain-containing protein [Arenibacter]|uniref:head GIN domain-containing protein n=1 Tax=Arenibacter TaxID=178469 RepID=UPI000A386BFB|nr:MULTISPECIES: head GIN domain-containing protein [Arenibacter]